MNRTPPNATLVDDATVISPEALAVIGTLARTYDAQRRRLLERRLEEALPVPTADSPLRPLAELEPAVSLDGSPVSASIVDAVVLAAQLAGTAVSLPLPAASDALVAAEAGWWDALLGDVERRTGLAPRTISVRLPDGGSPGVRAVFADRAAP